MLPIALEKMTKVIGLIMHSSKEYVCVMDVHSPVPEDRLRGVLGEFKGVIYQRPPLRSSVKRSVRRRAVHEIELLEYDGKLALMRVACDAGTYIRKLCWDIGLVLGVGAHMRELRRMKTGPFHESHGLVRLQDLSEAVYRWKVEGKDDMLRKVVMPGEYVVCGMPLIVLRDTAVESIAQGARLAAPGVAMVSERLEKGDKVAILTLKGELVAVGKAVMSGGEIIEASRGIVAEPLRVVMETGIYPRAWRRGGIGG
ncbi:MAG: RNA-guided pseudouridylation complex pseudouridine synthase subunit Cbf5 [Thermoprotei archaeon]|nr:RNA-guided pseudouridylation complex pseudouridine synthase subunit Cbf5 [Thermoprotei archaeon]